VSTAARGTELTSCRECGAQLAADQRYCLNCGARRGEPRLDFRRYAPADRVAAPPDPPPADTPPAAPTAEQKPPRDYTPLAAAGGIAVLGLMLLVGVLIGRGDGDAGAPAPPQVVRVEGDGGAATASEHSDGEGGGGALNLKAKGKSSGAKGDSDGAKAPPAEITASDEELEALQGQTGQDYSEAAAKLPNEIATPGKAPPTDEKKPGGGSSGTTIE
jgi:hypothetical protein